MAWFRRQEAVDPADVERLKAELASLREALDNHDSTTQALLDRLAALDDRVTSVSTELANQLTELGHDIDALADRPAGLGADGVDSEALASVREGQVKLANEQARYQIAFREDLARLAQDLKRPR
jgi:uncharacterized protein YhaN